MQPDKVANAACKVLDIWASMGYVKVAKVVLPDQ